MKFIRQLIASQRGASAIEYALVASLIAVACVAAFYNLQGANQSQYNGIANAL